MRILPGHETERLRPPISLCGLNPIEAPRFRHRGAQIWSTAVESRLLNAAERLKVTVFYAALLSIPKSNYSGADRPPRRDTSGNTRLQ